MRVSLFVEVDHFVEERLVKGLAAKRAAQQLDVEATLLEGLCQLVCNDGQVLVETALPRHLLLEHLGEELCGLVWLGQTDAADQLFEQGQVLFLRTLAGE